MCCIKYRVQEVVTSCVDYGTLQVKVEGLPLRGILGWHVSAVASATSVLFSALYYILGTDDLKTLPFPPDTHR